MKRNIFYPNFKTIILSIALFIGSILLILQLIPIFESQTIWANVINFIVFPPNFIFEDIFGINSVKFIDYITWFLQFLYIYIITSLILYLVKGGQR